MTHEEMIAVIQAHKEGKTIQYRPNGLSLWTDCDSPIWNFNSYDYRIKPEPHYRPFKNEEELFEAIKAHGNWVKKAGSYTQITEFNHYRYWIASHTIARTFEEEWTKCTFADGTPFGVKEE